MAEDTDQKNPFTRPGFILAAVVVALVVVLGVIVGVVNATRSDPESQSSLAASPSESSATPTADESAAAGDASVCGLSGEVLSGSISTAPAAKWEYQGTVAYPTSSEAGPTDTKNGVRTCFQHSPEGALFAAANAVVQGTDSATVQEWLDYFVTGPARGQTLSAGSGSPTGSGTRMEIAGFRVLNYDGKSALIDIAVRGSTSGKVVNLSMVYPLVWEKGDWKLNVTDARTPIDVATIPDLSGYIPWRP